MAVAIPGRTHVNTISGLVVLAERMVGIPGLLVVLYDLDPDTEPEELIVSGAAIDGGFDINTIGDRIGSVLTDASGSFSLSYADEEFRVRNSQEKRPDLVLFVMAPEAPGKTTAELVLYMSPATAARARDGLARLGREESRPNRLIYG